MKQKTGYDRIRTLFFALVLSLGLSFGTSVSGAYAAGPTDPMTYLDSMGTPEVTNHTGSLVEASFKKWVQEQIDVIKNPEHVDKIIGTCLEQLKAVGFVAGISAGWPSLDVILTTVINAVCDMVQQYWDQLLSELIYQFQLPSVVSDVLSMASQYGFTADPSIGFSRGAGDCSQDIDGDGVEDCVPVATVVISTPDGNQTYTTSEEDPVD